MCGAESIWVPRHPRTRLSSRVDPTYRSVPCPQTIGWSKAGPRCLFWDIDTKRYSGIKYVWDVYRPDIVKQFMKELCSRYPLTSKFFQGPREAAVQSLWGPGLTCISIDARTMSKVSFFHASGTAMIESPTESTLHCLHISRILSNNSNM